MSTLQEHLEDAYDVDVEQELTNIAIACGGGEIADRFVIDDESKAQWALRKLRRLEQESKADTDAAHAEIDRIQQWLAEKVDARARQASFFLGLLREYHEAELAADPSKKTIKLPAGTLKSLAGRPKWTVDAEAFLKWFDSDPQVQQERPELVRIKREPALSEIKAALVPKDDRAIYDGTGEIVPGVTVEPGQRSFSVEVAE